MDRESLLARRAELMTLLAANSVEMERAEAQLEESQAVYRATTDGLALSYRAIERASVTPEVSPREVKRLLRLHSNAEITAAKEYTERTKRWGHREGDGHLFACPLGGNPRLNRLLVAADVVGTYRVPPVEHETPTFFTVALSRPVPTGDVDADGELRTTRLRSRLRVPAHLRSGSDLTLQDVLGCRLDDDKGRAQLARFLGDKLLASVHAAIAAAHKAGGADAPDQ
ncbi:hypothetical protein [Dietzia sp. 179-F 9C3 NHS]|uniref:hypothetical protein n=1 Tax=Dietzia sp. 179-F 9C3 NHS TaxID=3374295 RepID=UPI0038793794